MWMGPAKWSDKCGHSRMNLHINMNWCSKEIVWLNETHLLYWYYLTNRCVILRCRSWRTSLLSLNEKYCFEFCSWGENLIRRAATWPFSFENRTISWLIPENGVVYLYNYILSDSIYNLFSFDLDLTSSLFRWSEKTEIQTYISSDRKTMLTKSKFGWL